MPEAQVPAPFSSAPAPVAAPIDHERLTPRESEVLTYLSKGFTIKEIANLMGIKWFTVNDHIKSIYKKLNVSSRAEAAVLVTVTTRGAAARSTPSTASAMALSGRPDAWLALRRRSST